MKITVNQLKRLIREAAAEAITDAGGAAPLARPESGAAGASGTALEPHPGSVRKAIIALGLDPFRDAAKAAVYKVGADEKIEKLLLGNQPLDMIASIMRDRFLDKPVNEENINILLGNYLTMSSKIFAGSDSQAMSDKKEELRKQFGGKIKETMAEIQERLEGINAEASMPGRPNFVKFLISVTLPALRALLPLFDENIVNKFWTQNKLEESIKKEIKNTLRLYR